MFMDVKELIREMLCRYDSVGLHHLPKKHSQYIKIGA